MAPISPVPPAAHHAAEVWLRCHDQIAPDLIQGLYLVGSAVLDDWHPSSDVDIIAFTSGVPDDDDVVPMREAHEATKVELGDVNIDGPRLAWSDIARPPIQVVRPWSLDGEFHHDDGCFEINPVMWFTLATYGAAIRGPETAELGIDLSPANLLSFVRSNTDSYWRSVADEVTMATQDPDRTEFEAEITVWAVLGIARMLFTIQTGDIASKSAAGIWLADQFPEHRGLVEHALSIRRRGAQAPDTRETADATAGCVHDIIALVMSTENGSKAEDS